MAAIVGALNRYVLNGVELNGATELMVPGPISAVGVAVMYVRLQERGMVVPAASYRMLVQ